MNVYTTLLTSENYLEAVRTLAYSIKAVKSKYPFIVMCIDTLPQKVFDTLKQENIQFQVFPNKEFTGISRHSTRNYGCTFNKFWAYKLRNVNHFMFIDADSCMLENIDYLFELPYPVFFFLDAVHNPYTAGDNQPRGMLQNADDISGCVWMDFCSEEKYEFCEIYQSVYGEDEQVLMEIAEKYYCIRIDYRRWNWTKDMVLFHDSCYGQSNKFWYRPDYEGPEQFFNLLHYWKKNRY